MKDDLQLTEAEIRSVIRGELRRILEEGPNPSMELSFVVSDAMLDGVRDVVATAARHPEVQKAVRSSGPVDSRQAAEKIVASLLSRDQDFRTDLVSLVAAMIKRAGGS